ncbi:hypothetical protein ACFZDG_12995 [Kitasatospora xanthocidica]|uniref:hypothetical protein n=1 Tax=Kitasatospora xanthocidica TaxID=83382 RepID=UPI0036E3923D
MRAGLRGPAPPPTAAARRAGLLRAAAPRLGTLRSDELRSGALLVLVLVGACALFAGGPAPAAAADSLITVVDNSNADSWLEIDRTANLQNGSGSAGSDHDGAGSLVGGVLGVAPSLGPALAGGGP